MRSIFFKPACLLLLLSVFASKYGFSQSILVKGNVLNNKGEPLKATTISVLNSDVKVVANEKGEYIISVPLGKELEFTHVGYLSKKVKVVNNKPINVILLPADNSFDEVVVVGYGVQKKANLTGAVSEVKGEKIANKVAVNPLEALQGEVPGVVVSQTNGQPGEEELGLTIRGATSVNAFAPLVLIDGVEGDLQRVNPQDIESISVLKDAASAAIYGSRAAGGVILIKTKTGGSTGKAVVSYAGQNTITWKGRHVDRLNSWDEVSLSQYANNRTMNMETFSLLKNPNVNAILSSETGISFVDNTNWLRVATNDYSNIQRHSVNVRGGTKPLNYMLSGGYFNNRGFLKYGPDNSETYNVRFNLNAQVNKNMAVFLSISDNSTKTQENAYGNKNLYEWMLRIRSLGSVYYPVDEDPVPNPSVFAGSQGQNLIDVELNGGVQTKRYNDLTGQVKLRFSNFNFIKGLSFDVLGSRRYQTNILDRYYHQLKWYVRGGKPAPRVLGPYDYLFKQREVVTTDKFNTVVNYTKTLFKDHTVSGLAGVEYVSYAFDRIFTQKNYVPDNRQSLNFGEASSATNGDLILAEKLLSVFGRINYSYKGKYLLEGNIRKDGSSRLAPKNRWKTYASISGGWVISKEQFFSTLLNTVNNLKLRASFGQLGNSVLLGYYDYLPLINRSQTIFNGTAQDAYYIGALPSSNLTWENIEILNFGIDINLFRNKLSFVGDIYSKKNINMLAKDVNVPSMIGVGVSSRNSGILTTKGWEFMIAYRDHINKFKYNVSFNLSDSKNTLTQYNDADVINEGITRLLEGYPLNTIWGYRTDGLFQQDPTDDDKLYQIGKSAITIGDLRYVNLDKDPDINGGDYTKSNHGDLIYFGTADPRYTFGFNMGAEYKNVSLNIFLQGVGRRVFVLDAGMLNPTAGTLYQPMDFQGDYWTPDNTDAFFPRPHYTAGGYNYRSADRWLQDGKYLRLKEIRLMYHLPIKSKFIESFDIYASGKNLWEATKTWKYFDPESPSLASTIWYPYNRSFTIGANLSF